MSLRIGGRGFQCSSNRRVLLCQRHSAARPCAFARGARNKGRPTGDASPAVHPVSFLRIIRVSDLLNRMSSDGYTDAATKVDKSMPAMSRRALITGVSAIGAAWGLAGCVSTPPRLADVDPAYRRTDVLYATREARGTIVVDPPEHFLYFVQAGGRALRYGVGVGGEGFSWSGVAKVHNKQEWPDWYPTQDILQRRPQLRPAMKELQSGMGLPGGADNPLGARALYLWQGNKDTLYRIHGTNEPWTIGKNVSAGCIRMVNDDVIDLYDRTPVGTKVMVLPSSVS
jgi:lipoprotein-anchoring transpeptidase ErfK/SrfK